MEIKMQTVRSCAGAGLFLLVAASLQGCANPVEPRCSAGPVGSCSILACYPQRGPTQCIGNDCMCQQGYCSFGQQLPRCRALVPDSTCTVSRVCWSGGLVSSTCVDGRCLCRTGMHVGEDGKCHTGWWPPSLLAGLNATTELAEVGADLEENHQVFMNMALAYVWFVTPTSLLAGMVAWVMRTSRARARQMLEVNCPYEEFPELLSS
eukprot:CAMPEP_0171105820 /NCGR_PEP_ID=MMETSP0766_2-20121228/63498_1 /TAXON_ID=439317 /ORGANISM="Gambierdiscus australes, Strain CAWD 149" /LENGTH=206 /DNA_ID=CAMNT_0011566769 /DNA_START=41 /DNA_END=661 /DNA_ORIENTATION=+